MYLFGLQKNPEDYMVRIRESVANKSAIKACEHQKRLLYKQLLW